MNDKAAVQGAVAKIETMADGGVRVKVDLHAQWRDLSWLEPGMAVALAALSAGENYGHYAQALRLSHFFGRMEVYRLWPDKDYRAWLRGQRCAVRSKDCAGDVVAAHVRRIAQGAGVATKPEYSAVALCDAHHRAQHSGGGDTLMPREKWEQEASEAVERWAWEAAREEMGVQSMRDASPAMVCEWAEQRGVYELLPALYRSAA